jgi:hypothetical protein
VQSWLVSGDPVVSLELIDATGVSITASIIDIGGVASRRAKAFLRA